MAGWLEASSNQTDMVKSLTSAALGMGSHIVGAEPGAAAGTPAVLSICAMAREIVLGRDAYVLWDRHGEFGTTRLELMNCVDDW